MAEIDFIRSIHGSTKRDYVQRVIEHDKAECAEVAGRWGADYWDGDRRYGYGGMRYDGRWRPVAKAMADHYRLRAGQRVLDIGCGKAFLLYELTQVVPGLDVAGIDISEYAIANAKEEMRSVLRVGSCTRLPWPDGHFDLAISINTFHNLYNYDLAAAISEMQRVSAGRGWLCVESYRNEREKANLLYWQLTCREFSTPDEWRWLFDRYGYTGDYGFIYFE
jgi:ubiquinone/menaquinone biosynthesis C-methylase UbiE